MSTASEARWQALIDEARDRAQLRHLLPLLVALVERPAVTRFFPFTSVGMVCISACSEWPFVSQGLPSVALVDGRFWLSVMGREPCPR